jgi:hypothetical protein
LVIKYEGKRPRGRLGSRWEEDIKIYLKNRECNYWILRMTLLH